MDGFRGNAMVLGASVYNMAEVTSMTQREMPKSLRVKGAKFSKFSEVSILMVSELESSLPHLRVETMVVEYYFS